MTITTSCFRHGRVRPLTLFSCALAAALFVLGAQPARADSMRCNGKLLLEGDTKARLLAECGEPLSKDVVAVERAYANGTAVRAVYTEVWTYPAPNTDGFSSLRFEAGRVVGEGLRCQGALIRAGDTAESVRERCGTPTTRDATGLLNETPGPAAMPDPVGLPIAEVLLEQWIYDRGPGKLQAIVVLEGGRIAAIEDGHRQ